MQSKKNKKIVIIYSIKTITKKVIKVQVFYNKNLITCLNKISNKAIFTKGYNTTLKINKINTFNN